VKFFVGFKKMAELIFVFKKLILAIFVLISRNYFGKKSRENYNWYSIRF